MEAEAEAEKKQVERAGGETTTVAYDILKNIEPKYNQVKTRCREVMTTAYNNLKKMEPKYNEIKTASGVAMTTAYHKLKETKSASSEVTPAFYGGFIVVLLIVLAAWGYQSITPPAPKICGSPVGAPITAPRIKLRDGRHLAYKEHGVSKDSAKYKIIYLHDFASNRHHCPTATNISPEVIEEVSVYVVSFDRPGYGESDPDPKRTPKSLAHDIEELADHLELGSKFYVIGLSMGGQAVWGCIKYIPHRLAGAALIAPVINYWWPGFPANLSMEAQHLQIPQDLWRLRVAHYAPWLTYWWNIQKWFPALNVAARPQVDPKMDPQLKSKIASQKFKPETKQQGEHESLHRDMMVGFGKWEFDPMELENLFPNNEGSVHVWHGVEGRMVPVSLQRYMAQKLPWIHYHEVPGAGYSFPYVQGGSEAILKALLLPQK